MGTKICSKCGAEKPIEQFYRRSSKPDGRMGACKSCWDSMPCRAFRPRTAEQREAHRLAQRRDRERDREAYNAKALGRRQQTDPRKLRARDELNNAIKRGRLARQPCVDCGSPEAQAHHANYDEPLQVEWLCAVCHGRRHRGERLRKRPSSVPPTRPGVGVG